MHTSSSVTRIQTGCIMMRLAKNLISRRWGKRGGWFGGVAQFMFWLGGGV